MKKSGKALLTTALVGGISVLIHNAKHLKNRVQASKHYNVAQVHSRTNHVKNAQKIHVNYIYRLIIPTNVNDYGYQKYVHEYLQALSYVADRYQMHSDDMAKMMNINIKRADNLTIALCQQHIVEHTDLASINTSRDAKGANFCRRKIARKDMTFLKSHMRSGLVNVKQFPHILKSIIAYHIV